MLEILVACAVGLLVLTAVIHSLLGERRLIGPLMRERTGVLASEQSRFLVRLCWHLVSILWLVLALILLALVWRPDTALRVALAAIGGLFLLCGVVDAAGTRFRHVGWPFLTIIGGLILTALAILFKA